MARSLLRTSVAVIATLVTLSTMISGQVHATGSNQIGMHISVNGVLHFVYGAESCASQEVTCGPGQSVFPYLTLGNGVNYVLVGGKVDAWPDGTRMLVTGWVTPSTASAPYLSFAGDIIITSIHAHCHMHQ